MNAESQSPISREIVATLYKDDYEGTEWNRLHRQFDRAMTAIEMKLEKNGYPGKVRVTVEEVPLDGE